MHFQRTKVHLSQKPEYAEVHEIFCRGFLCAYEDLVCTVLGRLVGFGLQFCRDSDDEQSYSGYRCHWGMSKGFGSQPLVDLVVLVHTAK